jgi:DHA2 family metal-tetracycline-proton antiporter-like MFS transporter
MYAPLVATAIREITPERSGVAIGFSNLTINVAVSVGIAYTAKLLDLKPSLFDGIVSTPDGFDPSFSNVLVIVAVVALLGLVVYRVASSLLARADRADGRPVETAALDG